MADTVSRILLITTDEAFGRLVQESDLPHFFCKPTSPHELLERQRLQGCVHLSLDWFDPSSALGRQLSQNERETLLFRLGGETIVYLVLLSSSVSSQHQPQDKVRQLANGPSESVNRQNSDELHQYLDKYRFFQKWLADSLGDHIAHVRHILAVVAARDLTKSEDDLLSEIIDQQTNKQFHAIFLMTRQLEPNDRQWLLHAEYIWPYPVGSLLLVLVQDPTLQQLHIESGIHGWRVFRLTTDFCSRTDSPKSAGARRQIFRDVFMSQRGTETMFQVAPLPQVDSPREMLQLWERHAPNAAMPPYLIQDVTSRFFASVAKEPGNLLSWLEPGTSWVQDQCGSWEDAMQGAYDVLARKAQILKQLREIQRTMDKLMRRERWWIWPCIALGILLIAEWVTMLLNLALDQGVTLALSSLLLGGLLSGMVFLAWRMQRKGELAALGRKRDELGSQQKRLAVDLSLTALRLKRRAHLQAGCFYWYRELSELVQFCRRYDDIPLLNECVAVSNEPDRATHDPALVEARDIRRTMNWRYSVPPEDVYKLLEDDALKEWLESYKTRFVCEIWQPFWNEEEAKHRANAIQWQFPRERVRGVLDEFFKHFREQLQHWMFGRFLERYGENVQHYYSEQYKEHVAHANYFGFLSCRWPAGYRPVNEIPQAQLLVHQSWKQADAFQQQCGYRVAPVKKLSFVPHGLPLVGLMFERSPWAKISCQAATMANQSLNHNKE